MGGREVIAMKRIERSAPAFDPARALLHPVWVLSLGLLVLNDHFLKGSGLVPGWLTGKLSDLAGLVVAPVLLAALFRARTPRAIAIAHVIVGLGFAGLEMSSTLTAAAGWVYGLAGFTWRSTSDVTDLLALAVLPLSYRFTLVAGAAGGGRAPQYTARILGMAGMLACTASSGSWIPQQPACGGPDCDGDGYSAPEDCNDADPNLNPNSGCPDIFGEDACDDGTDNDLDGLIDCDDDDCDLACADIYGACSSFEQWQFDQTTLLTGSTLTGTSVTDGSCVGADSPEVLFHGQTPPGVLTLIAPPGHGIHARYDCPDAYTEFACLAGTEAGGETLQLTFGADSAVTIVVEAIDPFQAGPFEVPIFHSPDGCGDGVRADPELCDDGNLMNGDGCTAACTPEPDFFCMAMPVAPIGQTMASFPGLSRSFVGPCAGSLDTAEQGFRYTAASDSVTVTVTSTADVALYTTLSCGEMAASLGCADAVVGSGMETLTMATLPGDELTFFVELAPGQPEDANFVLEVAEP
jgi:cysteine-rich repeat protein